MFARAEKILFREKTEAPHVYAITASSEPFKHDTEARLPQRSRRQAPSGATSAPSSPRTQNACPVKSTNHRKRKATQAGRDPAPRQTGSHPQGSSIRRNGAGKSSESRKQGKKLKGHDELAKPIPARVIHSPGHSADETRTQAFPVASRGFTIALSRCAKSFRSARLSVSLEHGLVRRRAFVFVQ